jgi:hypothetical protein
MMAWSRSSPRLREPSGKSSSGYEQRATKVSENLIRITPNLAF